MFGLDLAKTIYLMSMGALWLGIAPLVLYSIVLYFKTRKAVNDWVTLITDGLFVLIYTIIFISSIYATGMGLIMAVAFVLVVPASAYGFWQTYKKIAAQHKEFTETQQFVDAIGVWLKANGHTVEPHETYSIAIDRKYPGGYANFLSTYRLSKIAEPKK